jgi:sugar phosphate isomerase/epimerase
MKSKSMNRRSFLQQTSWFAMVTAVAPLAAGCRSAAGGSRGRLFDISLAEWSLHRTILNEKKLTNLDFPKVARREFGIDAVEYVNQMFMDKAGDMNYLRELRRICEGEGVRSVLIMCDGEGNLGDSEETRRRRAVTNHHKWAAAAKFLGCHAIRVNAATGNVGSFEEQQKRAANGLAMLSEYCGSLGLSCIVENHCGLSSNGAWLAGVMERVDMKNCGTLPDFGNYVIAPGETYDRYRGVEEMMPYA